MIFIYSFTHNKTHIIMKKLLIAMTAFSTAVIFFFCQQANAQTWNLAGNIVTPSSALGSTNIQNVRFISSNLERMRLDTFGRFGIGTTLPTARLHVQGNVRILDGTQGLNRILTSDASGFASWKTPFFWTLAGNSGTVALTNFIGTTDSIDFVIRSRNLERLRVTALGNVGIGTSTPASALSVGVNKFNVSRTDGDVIFTDPQGTIRFPATTGLNASMIQMFESGTQNRDRMVIAHSAALNNWGLQYQDTADKFNFLSGGIPVLTADLGSQRVGVGTRNPAAKFDIAGTGTYDLTGSYTDFRLGSATYNLKFGIANAGGGAGDGYIASSNRLYLGTSNTFARTQTMSINSNGTVGVGTFTPAAKFHVVGDAAVTTPVVQVTNSFVGSSDVRGISVTSKSSDGWGYGVEATGGFIGGSFTADAGAYTGAGYGILASASGSAGTRYGVYASASGGTDNWGGYFPTKTYASELRVGGTQGATGFVAAINGKLMATEVRVQPTASWPDYVFSKDHILMSLEELEAKINADKHLPGIPAANEMKETGIMLGEMQTKTMEKIEELTLYIIELGKQNKELRKEVESLKNLVNPKN